MEGLLLVDKPEGWTSFDVVNYVRKIIAQDAGVKPRSLKVGHTGTLDPAATGLLVLCIGKKYTKKVPELSKQDKTYIAQITFGATSTTGDKEGIITPQNKIKDKTVKEVQKALDSFVGKQKQIPHKYSAVKVGGKKAYDLARAGKEVKLKPKEITIYSIKITSFRWPFIELECRVGSGTYIRVLAEDIGKHLGTGAYLSGLHRTSVGDRSVLGAVDVKDLYIDIIKKKLLV